MPRLVVWFAVLMACAGNAAGRRRLRRYQRIDPRFARDIALTPAEIMSEGARPCWIAVGISPERAR